MKLTDSIYCKFLDGECFEHGVKCDNCSEKKTFDLLHLEKVDLEDSLLDPDKWEGKVDEEDQSPEFRNKGKLAAKERELTKTKIELKAANKHLTEIIDYAKFYICPTCTNACTNCPVWDFTQVECVCCGKMVYRKDIAGKDYNNDFICKKCEMEGSE